MVDFDKLDQIEKDRIFNEIVVTGLSLAVLMFKTLAKITKDERSDYYNELQMEMTSQYSSWLKELGTEKRFADMWKQLIIMRCEEYQKDFQRYKKELSDQKKNNPWIPVVAMGGYAHIRRGKINPKDPLFLFIVQWVKELAVIISKSV